MIRNPVNTLQTLREQRLRFGDGAEVTKLELLRRLARARLKDASGVLTLHELLCFMRAYPDNAEILDQVERMLAAFEHRPDLRMHRQELTSSGIAGTPIDYAFFAPTALWLAKHWGEYLSIRWDEFARADRIESLLPLLALYCETPGLDEFAFPAREWIERMKGPDETDAAFLLKRLERLRTTDFAREILIDDLDMPLRLSPGAGTPSRTHEKLAQQQIAFQSRPLSSERPRVRRATRRVPESIRTADVAEGRRWVELARSAMATRSRDLDAFAYGNPADVTLIDCGAGLQFVLIGMIPERRLLLETLYGYLMLKNGVPVGYGSITGLFNSAEVAYTVFDTYRSGEAADMFGWVLAIAKRVCGADAFVIDPYQIGYENQDALRSGAWWFYQKLGFSPRDREARQLMRRELDRMRRNPRQLSTIPTLKRLSAVPLFANVGARRDDVLGALPLATIGLKLTDYLSEKFGSDRERATRECAREAARLLGVRSSRSWTAGQRLAWDRWGPLVAILPGMKRWSSENRRLLVDVIRAKGGRSELTYLDRFNRHRALRDALRRLAD